MSLTLIVKILVPFSTERENRYGKALSRKMHDALAGVGFGLLWDISGRA